MRSNRDANFTVTRVPSGAHTIRAMLSPYQFNGLGSLVPAGELSSIEYPVLFTLNYKRVNNALYRPPGAVTNTAPRVSDKSAFKTHNATVGEAFSLTLPAADSGSGDGGPYQYILLKRGSGAAFAENGFSFDRRTRVLSGTPAAAGTHLLEYEVHDGDNNMSRSDAFIESTYLQIVVAAAAVSDNADPQQPLSESQTINQAPSFGAGVVTALSVPENSPAGTAVGAPVTATDPDEGDTLTYSLSGDDAALFAIDDTGQITTVAGAVYDYEVESTRVEPWYSLAVTAQDGAGASASTPVTVTLTDVDDPLTQNLHPEFHEGYSTTRELPENSPPGTRVGLPVTAYDPNGDALSYIALDGDDGAYFALDPDTGQISTIDGVTYDYDTKSKYEFMLYVMETDTDEGYMTGNWVTVHLTQANDPDTQPQPDTQSDTQPDSSSDPQLDTSDPQSDTSDPQPDSSSDPQSDSSSDPQSDTSSDSPAEPDPSPPTADAGADFDAKRGEALTLNGTGTAHAEGSQTLSYQWTVSDASEDELVTVGDTFLTNADQAQADFTMMRRKRMTDRSVLDNGNWIEFTLTVTDGDGETHSDTVRVTIQGTTWKPKQ